MAADETTEHDISTQAVHAGERTHAPVGKPVSVPLYSTSTFTYDSMAEMDEVFGGAKPGYIYTRYGNPTTAALEEAVRLLEAGAGACAYSSGMAAIHAALLACDLSAGATILASQNLYGATLNLLSNVFGAFGVKTVTADFSDTATLNEKARTLRPRALVAETISNPLLKICDIDACAEAAHSVGARFIIDNTFASPYLCQPLRHGADIVVHSATKYLGGHGDVTGGVAVVGDASDAPALVGALKLVGGVLGVWEAHEILRGVKTLVIRMERQCANAHALAAHLTEHPRIRRVYYPTLDAGDEAQEIRKRVLREPYGGALVAIELKEDTREAAFRFMDALNLCVRSTSLGDVFTSVLHPATASHRDLAPALRRELGITDGIVRISVGIEAIADIIQDIEQALER
ncbi:MAG TPA: PLP-dependent aspartate aminotransferase family protein [Pyrinomonadaceae bacterium]|jgi:cystathionine gamma-synthase/methionine-gamma-lyase